MTIIQHQHCPSNRVGLNSARVPVLVTFSEWYLFRSQYPAKNSKQSQYKLALVFHDSSGTEYRQFFNIEKYHTRTNGNKKQGDLIAGKRFNLMPRSSLWKWWQEFMPEHLPRRPTELHKKISKLAGLTFLIDFTTKKQKDGKPFNVVTDTLRREK